MADERLKRQIEFIVEIDQLKSVLRRTTIMSGSRQENSAEHSWHLALMALTLSEYADDSIDIGRVLRLVLLHDIVEVDAGDTFCYDEAAALSQAEREHRAALACLRPAAGRSGRRVTRTLVRIRSGGVCRSALCRCTRPAATPSLQHGEQGRFVG